MQSIEIDKCYLENVDKTKPVLYIPIAINKVKHPYPDCLKWIKNNFSPLGFDNFEMWDEEDLKNKKELDFAKFGGIYIGGGNTPKLLNDLRRFGTIKILESLAVKGVPIYGGSAGAVILAKTIIPSLSSDPNEVGLTDFLSLDFVQGYDIWCHYDESDDSTIDEYMKKYNLQKLIALPEDSGLYVTDTEIKVIGPNNVTIFVDNKSVLSPGAIIC